MRWDWSWSQIQYFSLMVSHCMLQDHGFEHFLGLEVSEFTLGDKDTDMGRQGMNMLIGELAEMLLRLYCCTDGIKGKPGHLLTLQGDDPIVNERLGVFLSLASNIMWSYFQPVQQSSAS